MYDVPEPATLAIVVVRPVVGLVTTVKSAASTPVTGSEKVTRNDSGCGSDVIVIGLEKPRLIAVTVGVTMLAL
jgi:hypothetical protein